MMKDLVYPAIFYKDDEKGTNTGWFTVKIPDVGIVTEGESIVDAYIKAKEHLCAMVDCALKFDCDIEAPSDFELVYKKNFNSKLMVFVMLIDALA